MDFLIIGGKRGVRYDCFYANLSSKRRKKYNILRVSTTHPGVFGYNAAANQRIFMSLMKIEVCQTTKSVSGKIQVQ